jgi:molybdopterin-binding protein
MAVPEYSVGEAAEVLGVSPDTVRRWVHDGQLAATQAPTGRLRIDGGALASLARSHRHRPDPEVGRRESARNHFSGIVTEVVKDTVMAQVELQAGPFRVVALVSREAVEELGLAAGVRADAVVKATNVSIERSD